ncbi:MAG: NAD/NADP octopine/nopaline dehydrogenase family protein [Steroidobacteraceae bacterium]
MRIAVLGGGHGCYAAAAELAEKGHEIRWWRRDAGDFAALRERGSLQLCDFRGERDVRIGSLTSDLAEAVAEAGLIVIPLPATTHDSLAQGLAPLLRDGQVVFLPPGTFGSYIFLKAMRAVGNTADVSFAETGTLPYLARKHSPTRVVVSAYATRLPTGVLPARNVDLAMQVLREAYPSVQPIEDALSGALMNAGPVIHPPLIIMNAGPLEHFERWDIHNEGTQTAIRRVTDALDNERIAVRESLGYGAPHFPLRDHYAKSGDEWMYGRAAHERLTDSGDWREKIVLTEHRYMLEDLRLGLSFLVSLGQWCGVPTPLAAGFLAIGSAITGRDFLREGRSLDTLGLAQSSRAEMQKLLQQGIVPIGK